MFNNKNNLCIYEKHSFSFNIIASRFGCFQDRTKRKEEKKGIQDRKKSIPVECAESFPTNVKLRHSS